MPRRAHLSEPGSRGTSKLDVEGGNHAPRKSDSFQSTISIVDLEVFYRVGVPDAERAVAQRLFLSVVMEYDFSGAAKTDDIADTIDYFKVTQRLLKFGDGGRNWKLIEKLAVDVADALLLEFQPDTVSVEVKKFIIPQAKHVAVAVRKSKE